MNGGSSLYTAGCEQIEHFRKLPRERRAHKDGIQLPFGSAAQQILGFFEPCGAPGYSLSSILAPRRR
jgi:hypothetical protein